MNRFGAVLGEEQWRRETNVALAPSIDVIRVPQWGRSFESYGEDPFFNGQIAIAEITGIQGQGPIADENMYLNDEPGRQSHEAGLRFVDERTLQEIYLPPFEADIGSELIVLPKRSYIRFSAFQGQIYS